MNKLWSEKDSKFGLCLNGTEGAIVGDNECYMEDAEGKNCGCQTSLKGLAHFCSLLLLCSHSAPENRADILRLRSFSL